ncbi:MAG: CARDB domain-containing protein [Patescibacteria group bacterium]
MFHARKLLTVGLVLSVMVPQMVGAMTLAPDDTTTGTASALQAQINALLAQIQMLQSQLKNVQGEQKSYCYDFNQNLRVGDRGAGVTALQTVLQSEGFPLKASGAGSFDEATAAAVVGFQEKYTSEILTPNGLARGSGYVGASTRAKLNKLYGCGYNMPNPQPYPTSTVSQIRVISPSAGAVLLLNSPDLNASTIIRWSSYNPLKELIAINLLDANGYLLKHLTIGTPDTGSYVWVSDPSLPNGKYQLEVFVAGKDGYSKSARSGIFSLTGQGSNTPSITVISPNGGEQYPSGQGTLPIKYYSSQLAGQSLTVRLYNPTFGDVRIFPEVASDNGVIYMDLSKGGGDPPGQYKVNICADNVNNPSNLGKPLCDISDNYFTLYSGIVPTSTSVLPMISYVSPSTIKAGDVMTVYGSNLYGHPFTLDGNYGGVATTQSPYGNTFSFVVPGTMTPGIHTLGVLQKATGAQGNSIQFTVVAPTNPAVACSNSGAIGYNQFVGCVWKWRSSTAPSFVTDGVLSGAAPSGPMLPYVISSDATALNFDWLYPNEPDVNSYAGHDYYSAAWKGKFTFEPGTYKFTGGADDGIRVRANGATKIDLWQNGPWKESSFEMTFTSRTSVLFEIDYFEEIWTGNIKFGWTRSDNSSSSTTQISYAAPVPVWPKGGEALQLGQSYTFSVQPVAGASGYLFGFKQDLNGDSVMQDVPEMVFENLRDLGQLSSYPNYNLILDSTKFRALPMEVWVRGMINGQWTDALVTRVNVQGQSVSNAVDLMPTPITYAQNTAGVRVGDSIWFDSGIKNGGNYTSGIFNVKWFVDGIEKGYGSHASVAAGATEMSGNSQFNWTAEAGAHVIDFVVDPESFVGESNENNNKTSITVTVSSPIATTTVAAPVLLSQAGNETWAMGSTQTIRWQSDAAAKEIRVLIIKDRPSITTWGIDDVQLPVGSAVAGENTFQWVVSAVNTVGSGEVLQPGTYRIRVCHLGSGSTNPPCATSSGLVTIVNPTTSATSSDANATLASISEALTDLLLRLRNGF